MTKEKTQWKAGQTAVISRDTIVIIDRVTPSGRAIVGGRTFEADGLERVAGSPYRRAKLEHITPEIQAEMALVERGQKARRAAQKAVEDAGQWLYKIFSPYRHDVPEANDVDEAERLAKAIKDAMEGCAP